MTTSSELGRFATKICNGEQAFDTGCRPNDNVARGVRSKFFVMEPKGEQLRVIGQLLESGKCHPAVDSVFPIESFQQAFDRAASGHAGGKVIIEVAT